MIEEPFFFEEDERFLFGVLHHPRTPAPVNALVLCHPFGEEKLWSHRVFVNLARKAAEIGIVALRFDMTGQGDSAGQTEDCTIDTYLSDIDLAVDELNRRYRGLASIGLLGLRFGATLAALYSEQSTSIDHLVLWEPIEDGHRYMQELLRVNLSTQLSTFGRVQQNREQLIEQMRHGACANVDGYLISHKFYEQCLKIKLHCNSQAECLVVQIAPNIKQKDRVELVAMAGRYSRGHFLKTEKPPFWREIKPFCSTAENLIDATIQWWVRKNDE